MEIQHLVSHLPSQRASDAADEEAKQNVAFFYRYFVYLNFCLMFLCETEAVGTEPVHLIVALCCYMFYMSQQHPTFQTDLDALAPALCLFAFLVIELCLVIIVVYFWTCWMFCLYDLEIVFK